MMQIFEKVAAYGENFCVNDVLKFVKTIFHFFTFYALSGGLYTFLFLIFDLMGNFLSKFVPNYKVLPLITRIFTNYLFLTVLRSFQFNFAAIQICFPIYCCPFPCVSFNIHIYFNLIVLLLMLRLQYRSFCYEPLSLWKIRNYTVVSDWHNGYRF